MRKIFILLLIMLQCNLFLLAQEARTNSNEKAAQESKAGSASSAEAEKTDDTKKSDLNGKTGNTEPTEWSIFGNANQSSGTNTTTTNTGANTTSTQQEPSGWTIYTKRPTVVVYTVKSLIPENKWDF